jgi:hypothetical protein
MSLSPAPSTHDEPLFAREYAVRLMTVLLVAFAGIIALTGFDESRRDKLETFEEVTAVGDQNFFPVPKEPQQPAAPAATFQGKALVPTSYELVKRNDPEMIRVGQAEGAPYRIYMPKMVLSGEAKPSAPGTYYLKVEQDRYVRVRAASPQK